jgi:hypothetical protein
VSYAGEYATFAAKAASSLAPVLEIDLIHPTWDDGYSMYLSDSVNSARGNVYEPLIEQGGWSGVTFSIDPKAPGLAGQTISIKVADPKNKVRDALIARNQRGSVAAIYRVVPGSADDYDSRFRGVLDTWEFNPGQVVLNCKTYEAPLFCVQPEWFYLGAEWFQLDPELEASIAPLLYGKHDSTGLNLGRGLLPTTLINTVSGWYSVCFATGDFVKDVFVNDVLQTPGVDYGAVQGSLAGGKTFTIFIWLLTPPTIDDVVTCNAYGYAASGFTAFDGASVMTNPVEQIRHLVVVFGVERTRGYQLGPWSTTADIIAASSWDAAADDADAQGLEGSRFIQEQNTVNEHLREWCQSFPRYRPYWGPDGAIEIAILSCRWPGYWDEATPVITPAHELEGSFSYKSDAEDVCGKITFSYLHDAVGGKYLRKLTLQDPSIEEQQGDSVDMPWQPARQV